MKKQFKKISAILLSVAMLCSSIGIGGTVLAEDSVPSSYTHSNSYNTIYNYFYNNKKFPTDYADTESYFTYLYGKDGSYQEMQGAHNYYGWRNNWALGWSATEATYPGVNSWFMATTPDKHSVIDFHAQQSGEINITANGVYAGAAGVQMVIVQRRGENYYPIYPQKGSWDWKDVDETTFDLNVTTTVAKGDEILVIAGGTVSDILCINPIFSFAGNEGTDIADSAFTAWGVEQPDESYTQNSYKHSEMFKTTGTAQSNTIDGCYFAYEYGVDGVYNQMARYYTGGWNNAWVWSDTSDIYPWITDWFMGAVVGSDAVIKFHSARSGEVTVSSAVSSDTNAGRELMVVQKRGTNYYPIYPTAGEFEWKDVTGDFDLSVTTTLKAEDEILIIGRCNEQIIQINPVVTFSGNSGTEIPDDNFYASVEWPNSGRKVIACVGASNTWGVGADDRTTQSYPAVLEQLLGDEYRVVNCGMSGYCATPGTELDYRTTSRYQHSLACNPDMVILLLGQNDCRTKEWEKGTVTEKAYKQGLLELVHTYENLPSKPEVVLMNIPVMNNGGFSSDILPSSQRAILRAQAEVAKETGCRFINLHGFTTDKTEWYADALHFNTTGYAAIAEYIAEKILEPIYGDANFDRKVNILDIVRTKKYFADSATEIDKTAADFDKSDNITVEDFSMLKKYLLTGERANRTLDEWEQIYVSASTPAKIMTSAQNDLSAYADGTRKWQGVPSLGITENGKLWACWMSGGTTEPQKENYVTAYTSTDDGNTWEQSLVVDIEGSGRVLDANFWTDPDGKLWFFWTQSFGNTFSDGRWGVFAAYTENPDDDEPTWSEPKRVANGTAINNPIVLEDGTWLLPTALWEWSTEYQLEKEIGSSVYASVDGGKTWSLRGTSKTPLSAGYSHCENSIVQLKDGTLRMNIRTRSGQYTSYSSDKGYTWTTAVDAATTKTDSRVNLRRLASGNLLMVYNNPPTNDASRSYMTAALSLDEGASWQYKLIIDERLYTSYPDIEQDAEGNIYISYDYDRAVAQNILMVKITEEEIMNGGTLDSDRRILINSNGKGEISISSFMFPSQGWRETSYKTGNSYFTYEYGKDGTYQLMKGYYTSSDIWASEAFAWSQTEKTYPWIGDFFIGGSSENDGVLNFHAGTTGEVKISDRGSKVYASGGVQQFMIVQKRGEGYYPIYPTVGEFEWKDVDATGFVLPEITTTVEAGDEILFIARCDGQIVCIQPQIEYVGNVTAAIPAGKFTAWGQN